ncbi:unnamed protein product [Ceutorhynchus assimilis]|uniref:Cytochrome P450 n=1 Tax=Ceutorhynchus assimilis TaxID=467358 RepID=A0A9N9MUN6_9CUCU|nr:unnamed protein product [Ceutorhynchus assimilis]
MEKKVLIFQAFFVLFVIWILKKYRNYFRAVLLAFKLPGPAAVPIIGNVLYVKDTEAFLGLGIKMASYVPIFRAWIFFVPFFLVYEPEHLKVILANTKVSDKNFFYAIMHNFIGDGLITSTGEKWKKHRRLIQPHFQINILESYFEDFVAASDQILTKLSGQRHIQITRTINSCILNILHKTILGVDLKSEFDSPFRRGELLLLKRILKPWLLLDSVFKRSEMSKNESKQLSNLHQYVKQVLDDRRVEISKGSKTNCVLDRLIEISENDDFSDEDIVNEAVTFMLAGQDSVGAAIAFCLHYLAKYQNIQDKVYKEIDQIICGNYAQSIQLDQVNRMHYLEQCLKETMRLMPSIPLVARELTTDVTLENHTIPAGTNIFISPYATQRLAHIFPNPHEFDPDRFSQENIKNIHPYAYLPFSAGPRHCIGYKFAYLEMKTIIATIIKNYILALCPCHENLTPSYRVSLRAKGGVWLDMRLRNSVL